MPKIMFNGQEYDNPEAMPPEIRQLYDMVAGMLAASGKETLPSAFQQAQATVMSTTQLIVDGKTYGSIEELPPEIRAKYEQAMRPFDTNQNGIPDILEGGALARFQTSPTVQPPQATVAKPTQPALVTVVGEGRSLPASLTIALIVIVALVGVILFLLLR